MADLTLLESAVTKTTAQVQKFVEGSEQRLEQLGRQPGLGEEAEDAAAVVVADDQDRPARAAGGAEQAGGVVEQREVAAEGGHRLLAGRRHPKGGGHEPVDPRQAPVGQQAQPLPWPGEGVHVAHRHAGADHQGGAVGQRGHDIGHDAPHDGWRADRVIDKVVPTHCPYCAVQCGMNLLVEKNHVVGFEPRYDFPVNEGRLCPKGAASRQLHEHPRREYKVKYRRPHGTEWEELDLDTAMEMIADRLIATRAATWEDREPGPPAHRLNRTLGFAHLGGATLDNEENYLIKKFFTAMGALQIENQARI